MLSRRSGWGLEDTVLSVMLMVAASAEVIAAMAMHRASRQRPRTVVTAQADDELDTRARRGGL